MQKYQPQIVEPFELRTESDANGFTLKFAYESNGERCEVRLKFPSWWRDLIRQQLN